MTEENKAKPRAVVSNEKMLHNGTVMNRGEMGAQRFLKGTKFWLANESYQDEFKVIAENKDTGTDFRQIRATRDDVVVTLTYLQSQYAQGNLKLLDDKGDIIDHDKKSV